MNFPRTILLVAIVLVPGACSKGGDTGVSSGPTNPFQAVVQAGSAVSSVTGISYADAEKMMGLVAWSPNGSGAEPPIMRQLTDSFVAQYAKNVAVVSPVVEVSAAKLDGLLLAIPVDEKLSDGPRAVFISVGDRASLVRIPEGTKLSASSKADVLTAWLKLIDPNGTSKDGGSQVTLSIVRLNDGGSSGALGLTAPSIPTIISLAICETCSTNTTTIAAEVLAAPSNEGSTTGDVQVTVAEPTDDPNRDDPNWTPEPPTEPMSDDPHEAGGAGFFGKIAGDIANNNGQGGGVAAPAQPAQPAQPGGVDDVAALPMPAPPVAAPQDGRTQPPGTITSPGSVSASGIGNPPYQSGSGSASGASPSSPTLPGPEPVPPGFLGRCGSHGACSPTPIPPVTMAPAPRAVVPVPVPRTPGTGGGNNSTTASSGQVSSGTPSDNSTTSPGQSTNGTGQDPAVTSASSGTQSSGTPLPSTGATPSPDPSASIEPSPSPPPPIEETCAPNSQICETCGAVETDWNPASIAVTEPSLTNRVSSAIDSAVDSATAFINGTIQNLTGSGTSTGSDASQGGGL